MPESHGPIFYSHVKCPVCDTVNAHANVRTGAYHYRARDTDYCPTGLVWDDPSCQKFDPLLFFMATCQKCFYTREYNAEFKAWEKDIPFNTYQRPKIRDKHSAALNDKNGLIQFLGPRIDVDRYPTETAIIKFVLGICDEMLTEHPSALNLARYFLRIGWLFRSHATNDAHPASAKARDAAVLGRDAKKAVALLNDYDGIVKNLSGAIERVASPLPEEVMKEISVALPRLMQATSTLATICDEAEQAHAGQSPEGESYYSFRSFKHFLNEAARLQSDVPTTEEEALSKSAAYYRKAYETGSQVKEGVAQVQTAYLIAELARRARDFNTAEQYFNTVLKLGWEVGRSDSADASTVNQTNKILELAREQARVNKEQSTGR